MSINSNIRLTEISRQVKQPAVAGSFYPSDSDELTQILQQLLESATKQNSPPKAILAPHAGYIYSGPVAANAYASLYPVREKIQKVILLGPAHRVYVKGIALSSASHFATPLGEIEVDKTLIRKVSNLPGVEVFDEAFSQEHSLEVHLPFLQIVLNKFTLLPVVVGDASPEMVATLIESVWGDEDTLIVISTDLSHFHDYQTANQIDNRTAEYIKQLNYEKVGPKQACGCRPVSGLLKIAKDYGHEISVVDVRNSGDTAGNHDRVVGYGSFMLYEKQNLSIDEKKQLLDIANRSIEYGLENGTPLKPDVSEYPGLLSANRGVFVTLEIDHQLRGCIGNLEPVSPLVTSVAMNAFNAAFNDPRFQKLQANEFNQCEISISVLTPRQEIKFLDDESLLEQLIQGTDGLIIHKA
ncbi:MAG: AmmeMemoRadiSam system protein B, partial [Gammaproteobacteria bacterium]|nr:AmmeMemoRadiSam system protein B [Gammaproteobacteria bacterium]